MEARLSRLIKGSPGNSSINAAWGQANQSGRPNTGRPLPWRACTEEIGQVWAANGEPVVCADGNGELPNAMALAHARLTVLAVNYLGGFRPEALAKVEPE